MAEQQKDFKKLQRFTEAALTNPRHPVYQLGMQHSTVLQHYAVNVKGMGLLETVEAEQWFKDYPKYTEMLEKVMALCEEDTAEQTPAADGEDEATRLRTENEQLKARVAELEKAGEKPAGE